MFNRKTKTLIAVALFLALAFSLSPSLFAQESAAKGSINGTVVDSTGGTIVGATVALSGAEGTQTAITSNSGIFIFQDLIPGFYQVRVEMKGFKVAQVGSVEVHVGRVTAVRLQLEPGSITQTVEVVSSAITVDTTSTAVASNFSDDFYSKIPAQRNVAGLFYLAPGVVSGGGTGASNPSIGGATGLENLYVADGVSITDTAFGGLGIYSRVYGSVGTGINLTFIKEVQVKTGSIQSNYGGATGGVVQIVTKSGSHDYHGAIAGYYQPNQFEASRLNPDDFGLVNQFGKSIHNAAADLSGEIGGSVPHFRDKLFFFGSMDPSETQATEIAPPNSGNFAFGDLDGRQLSYNYAAKLTFKINDRNSIEGSVFGDPTHSNSFPWIRLAQGIEGTPNNTNFSKLTFGNRDVVARYNGTLSPTWVLNMSVTWQHNRFTESGFDDTVSEVTDNTQVAGLPGQQGAFTAQGRGFVENTEDDSYGFNINTTKIVNFWGQHSFDIGYNYNRPFYKGERAESGPAVIAPSLNSAGDPVSGQCAPTCPWASSFANYNWTLLPEPGCPTAGVNAQCALLNVPGVGEEPVALSMFRSEYNVSADGFKHFTTTGRIHAAYANDNWTINKYVTLNMGIRWQQERLIGEQANYTFTDNWSPSLGVTVDPIGDRKNKIWFSFGRYNYNLPLDLAERSLTNETDLFGFDMVPAFTVDAAGDRVATVNQFGSVTPVVDSAHTLNGLAGGPFANAGTFGSLESLENIHSGTKLTYEDEYVIGAEHEFSHGVVATVRYTHRSLRRIVEDTGGIAPEAALAGVPQQFSITNPSKGLDIFTNPIQNDFVATTNAAGKVNNAPAACTVGATPLTGASFVAFPLVNSLGIPVTDSNGNTAACFSQAVDTSGSVTGTAGAIFPVGVNGEQAGSVTPDGIPDGFADPIHKYWAVEFEVNKSFSHNWQLRTNYRIAKLFGNFEGAFRNDNGQSDPGISSLFDFTPGQFNLLGGQFIPGILNTDRQQVANGYFSYVFDHGMLKNLTIGPGIRIQTGTPITELAAHPVYLNAGEVPIAGRGNEGFTPTTGQVDLHMDYVHNLTERLHLRFGVDLFNIANTKRILYFNQNIDLQFGVPNADFLKPAPIPGTPISSSSGIQAPFNARVFFRLEF